jgi:hypothetical protein
MTLWQRPHTSASHLALQTHPATSCERVDSTHQLNNPPVQRIGCSKPARLTTAVWWLLCVDRVDMFAIRQPTTSTTGPHDQSQQAQHADMHAAPPDVRCTAPLLASRGHPLLHTVGPRGLLLPPRVSRREH